MSLLVSGAQLSAQCYLPSQHQFSQRPGQVQRSSAEALLPESGLLTDDTYTNLFFGISLRLPLPVHGHRLMLPIRVPGEHALLALGLQDGQRYGTFEITAVGNDDADDNNITPEQARRREDELARGKPGASSRLEYTPPPLKLKRVDKHAGQVHGTQFTAHLRNFTLQFTIQTNDKPFLEKARQAVEDLRVFCSDDEGRLFTTDGKPYVLHGVVSNGPTIPTAIVDEALRKHPAQETIPTGTVSGDAIHIPELEFSYTLPAGWITLTKSLAPEDVGVGDTLSERLDSFWQSCARTVLFATSGPDHVAKLELRVLDQTCFGLPAPAALSDWLGSESLGQYLQMLGRFGKIKSNRLMQSGGRLFAEYEGTVAAGPPVSHLSQRDAEVIQITRYGKLLFAWCWSAPTMGDLDKIPVSRVTFASGATIPLRPADTTSQNSSQR